MKTTIATVFFASFLGLLVGCAGAVALTTRGAMVELAEQDALHPDCKPIREVQIKAKNFEEGEIILRNKAGTMAAQKIVIVNKVEVPGGVAIVGKAYGCPSGV